MGRGSQKGASSDAGSRLNVALLGKIGTALTSSLSLPEVLRVLMEAMEDLLAPTHWSLLLHDPFDNVLRFEVLVGDQSQNLSGLTLSPDEGLAGWCFAQREPVVVADAYEDSRFNREFDKHSGFTTGPLLCVPLIYRDSALGVIEIVRTRGSDAFTTRDVQGLMALAQFAAVAIYNARYLKTVEEQAIQDDVTGLFNVRHLRRILDREIILAKRYKRIFSVIFIDLDHFKSVNDIYGHLVGSAVLREVGAVLVETLREADLAFRYGGDEFVIVLPNTDRHGAVIVAERLRQRMKDHAFQEGPNMAINLTASFGVATYPENAESTDDLIRMADDAMYRIKHSTRDGVSG